MSIPINTDNSVQLSYSSFPFTVADIDNYATSNFVSNVSNALRTAINTKQDTLTAATNLLGVGTSITAIDYNKVSVNKPTNFQADWNSTIINKPTIYTQSQIDTFLNAKQNNLTAATTLLGTGGSITGINYNTVINKPSYSTPLSSNIATNTISIDLSNYYNQTQVNTAIIGSSNYSLNISNVLKSNIDANNTTIINNYLPLAGGTMTGTLYVNSNIQTQQLYINNPASTASIFFTPNYSIYSIFSRKVPWAMYFAEDYNTTTNVLPNYISNGIGDATTTGTISKLTGAGNGATGILTYITGGTAATMTFPTGSIPTNFTILGLARYTGAAKQRILRGLSRNWLHGHYASLKGQVYYEGWKTNTNISSAGLLNDWLCCIGKNGGSIPGNILADGVGVGTAIGGVGDDRLSINIGPFNEPSDWALSCVMIWDTHLTDAEMVDLNTIINNYKNDGISIKSLIASTIDDDSVIESRVYSGFEKTELLLFKGNDATGANGADRIRLKAGNIAFDTYSTLTPSGSRNTENIVMLINENGNVGIGTTTNLSYKLNVNGSINSTSLYQNGTLIDFTSYATKNTDIINTSNYALNISNILKTNIDTKDNILSFTSPLTRTVNTITFNESAITTLTNFYNKTETNNLVNAKDAILSFTSPLIRTVNTITFSESAITTLTNFYNKTETNNLLNAKQATLTFSSPLVNTTNTITFNESSITTLTNFYNKTDANARYLQLTGGTMSAGANIITTGNIRAGSLTAGETTYQLLIGPPTTTAPAAIQTILQGSGYNQKLALQAAGGNVGIGTTNPLCKLQVNGIVNITNTSPYATANNNMQSGSLTIGDTLLNYGGGNNFTTNTAGLMLECLNNTEIAVHDAGNRLASLMYYTGNTITIGRDMGWNALSSITMNGNITYTGYLTSGNNVWNRSADGIYRTYYETNSISYYCCGGNSTEGHIFMNNGYSHVFKIKNNGDVYVSGNVGIGTQPTLQKLEVNGPTNITGSLSVQSADLHTFKSPGGLGGNFNCAGNITCLLYSITNSGTDYVGVGNASSGNNQNYLRQLYIMFETFTGFHRCFTNDELFDNENPQNFKDTYIGRIVVSTGKIATDFKSIDNDDWEIKYDKEGITIEDALPMIELSRKKKDKRVFGVLGNSKRNNSRSERLIINSVGEGGIFVCNSNGNIENGDYIQSSDHLGYGEKQDEIFLCNYTVAKATMDCDFELDSPLYNCFELDDGLRVAFVAATYHCG